MRIHILGILAILGLLGGVHEASAGDLSWKVEITCSSEDDGDFRVVVPANQYEDPSLIVLSPAGSIGRMPRSGSAVYAYFDGRRSGVGFEVENGSIYIQTRAGFSGASVRQVLFGADSALNATVVGQRMDPEGISCRIKPIPSR